MTENGVESVLNYVATVYDRISEEKKERLLEDIDRALKLLKNKNSATA